MLKLMYVEGINFVDTPNFNSIEQQRQYFQDKVVIELTDDDYFYPPYYDNEIIIDPYRNKKDKNK